MVLQTTMDVKEKGAMRAPLQRAIRRQVAEVLRKILRGDEKRQSQASIKTLIYERSVLAKKATLALTCRCLKYLPVLKEIMAETDLLSSKKKVSAELLYVTACDLLFGQEALCSGLVEDLVLKRRNSLQSALSRLLIRKKVSSVDALVASNPALSEGSTPRYVRVNTLKTSFAKAMEHFRQRGFSVKQDGLIPELLVFPGGTDLHDHPLVLNGSLILQGKASCMPALALAPKIGWNVLDACAAPGNKTVHLAALMQGTGKIYAFDKSSKRVQTLQETVKLAGAENVDVLNEDFLKLDPAIPPFSMVQAILLDPSCSGSGTAQDRLDHLLPSTLNGGKNFEAEQQRLDQLGRFQEKALMHALSFPAVERLVYSTCSIHERENETVIKAVLPYAHSLDFHLETPFPEWELRGHPSFNGAHHVLRTDPIKDHMDGFFVALFVRNSRKSLDDEESHKQQINQVVCSTTVEETSRQSKQRRRKLKRQRKKAKLEGTHDHSEQLQQA